MIERLTPLRSSLHDGHSLEEEAGEFVIGLAEYVDLLQDAEASGDFDKLLALAQDLLEAAQKFGYGPLDEVVREVCTACYDEKAEAAREALVELTKLGRRIRLGHRGAA